MNEMNPHELRVIKTARTEKSINDAAKKGLRPLVKAVLPSKKIKSKIKVLQHRSTGRITLIGDYRAGQFDPAEYDVVIDWMEYYPHSFAAPFAAYLIPSDLKIGDRVYLEDLIEDLIGMEWNQGDVYRLEGCEAVWNGKDFDVDYDPKRSISYAVG